MSRNPHRLKWIGRADVPGWYCHATDCHEFAGSLRAKQLHADLFEPLVGLDARTLIAHHLLKDED